MSNATSYTFEVPFELMREWTESATERAVDKIVREKAESAIESAVMDELLTVVREKTALEVAKILDDGFPLTNTYGEPTGETQDLASAVRKVCFSKGRHNRTSKVDEIIENELRAAMNKELKSVVSAAKTKLTEQISTEFGKGALAVLRSALR